MNIMRLKWNDYCTKFHTNSLFFTNKNKDIIISISEGTGYSLAEEDIGDGYCDYWYISFEDKTGVSGGSIILTETLIKEANQTIREIVKLLKDKIISIYGDEDIGSSDSDYHLITKYEANMIHHFLYDIKNETMDDISFDDFDKKIKGNYKTDYDKYKEYYENAADMFIKDLKAIKKEISVVANTQPKYHFDKLIVTDTTVYEIIDKYIENYKPKG